MSSDELLIGKSLTSPTIRFCACYQLETGLNLTETFVTRFCPVYGVFRRTFCQRCYAMILCCVDRIKWSARQHMPHGICRRSMECSTGHPGTFPSIAFKAGHKILIIRLGTDLFDLCSLTAERIGRDSNFCSFIWSCFFLYV